MTYFDQLRTTTGSRCYDYNLDRLIPSYEDVNEYSKSNQNTWQSHLSLSLIFTSQLKPKRNLINFVVNLYFTHINSFQLGLLSFDSLWSRKDSARPKLITTEWPKYVTICALFCFKHGGAYYASRMICFLSFIRFSKSWSPERCS